MKTSSLPACDLACAEDRLPLGMLSAHTCGLAPSLGCSMQVLWFGSLWGCYLKVVWNSAVCGSPQGDAQ